MLQHFDTPQQQANNPNQASQDAAARQENPETDLGNKLERESAGVFEITPEHTDKPGVELLQNDAEPEHDTVIQMASGLEEGETGNKYKREQDFTGE